jgi:cobalamin biosynthetic protein CobC
MDSMQAPRDHGGNLDSAITRHGGTRANWLDLSTGINPEPYPIPQISMQAWTALPDQGAADALISAARDFWNVPDALSISPVPGASAAIAHIPLLATPGRVNIPAPTYNEHAASFAAAGWNLSDTTGHCDASVHVHPNNPDGRLWQPEDPIGTLQVIDESFCDVMPDASLMGRGGANTLILKSFGKFWGLAGVRLGFVIGQAEMLDRLSAMLGPWAVAGPAMTIGTQALRDHDWADKTRVRLARDATKLDAMLTKQGASLVGGTSLFRLYTVQDAAAWQDRLAQHHIWSRVFPYNPQWIRLGLPNAAGWATLERALA